VHFTTYGMTISQENLKQMFAMLGLHAQLSNAENEERAYCIRQAMEGRRQKLMQGKATFGRLPAWLKWDAPPSLPLENRPLRECGFQRSTPP
jgi:hypothetical protein